MSNTPRVPVCRDSWSSLDTLVTAVRRCRICRDAPQYGRPLDHEPRPIVQVSATARICIAGQAPGIRAHARGLPFADPSGVRLRQWMGIDEEAFYDAARIAILPMGFCFPGLNARGSDLPPRRECALAWRAALFTWLPRLELLLLVGRHAQQWHLRHLSLPSRLIRQSVHETVRGWREIYEADERMSHLVLPHPSWRNSGWLKRNPWFEAEVIPVLREKVHTLLSS
ncbi:MAG: uracil-DNA glycosylase family protein [Desulfobulbus sp.]|nr:uracil-DNA glycosylase family protein [Desulfobulbus sp.]